MKKSFLLLAAMLFLAYIGYAQTVTPQPTNQQQPKGFEGVGQYVEKEELIIEVKSLIPPTGVFQVKSDTSQKSGEYKFSFSLEDIRKQSDILLNKWLKESK